MRSFNFGIITGFVIIMLFLNLIVNYKTVECEGVDSGKQEIEVFNIVELADKEIERLDQERIEKELEEYRKSISKGIIKSVPNTNTNMKTYMDYKKIANKSSAQYKLQKRDDIYTDEEGFRRIGDYFVVAVGTYYTSVVGTQLEIELSTGRTFKAIVGDIKDNRHTDKMNRQHNIDGSVLEFLVDTKHMDKFSKKMGDVSHADKADLKGDVVSIIVFED